MCGELLILQKSVIRHTQAHPRPRSHTLTRIAGDSTSMACFRPRPPRESEFATDRPDPFTSLGTCVRNQSRLEELQNAIQQGAMKKK